MNGLDRIAQIPNAPTHALHAINNWDGEGDRVFLFAFERDGVFYDHETGKPVLEYEGDEVLQAWPLTPNAELTGASGDFAAKRPR